ncbi:MAG TPA: FAD-dependent oxidoreductase [Stellaceae bacterium]|nr:FAD-dependent oxidoreductase [Stellaceae bacterium]
MTELIEADVCVIGAGSGGLSVAAGASQLGAKTVLFEHRRMGGDCLNFGCVPSKALLAAAKRVGSARENPAFGLTGPPPGVDFAGVMAHVHGVIAAIEPNDSQARFEGLGVHVVRAFARFAAPDTVEAEGVRVRARRIVIATGSSPATPPIPGLDAVPFFTNETIFENRALPRHLIVVGGGPIGIEMAQAHRLLGAEVTVLEALPRIMPKDDPELVALLAERLRADGVTIRTGVKIGRVESDAAGAAVVLAGEGGEERLAGSHLLVAAGRRANLKGLELHKAGIAVNERGGLVVDRRLRTTNRRVYAMGDAAGGPQFTHVAGYHAGIVIRNALFRLPAKVDYRALPWVTYTEPELAHVGLTEAEAREHHARDLNILRWPFHENDRAQAERSTHGVIKVVTRRNGRILGASILGPEAGELIHPWVLAIGQGLKIGALATMIAPYPTLGEVGKRAAGSFFTPKLFSERTKRLVKWLSYLG